jgi:hypothetical protein
VTCHGTPCERERNTRPVSARNPGTRHPAHDYSEWRLEGNRVPLTTGNQARQAGVPPQAASTTGFSG